MLGRNPYFPVKFVTLQNVVNRCVGLVMERIGNPEAPREKADMLDGYLDAKESHPDAVDIADVIGYAVTMVSAPESDPKSRTIDACH